VAQAEVFYFHEFRDDATSTAGRKSSWNNLVLAKSWVVDEAKKHLSERQIRYKRARDTTKIVIEPSQSFANDLVALTAELSINPSLYIVKELKRLLKLTDEDLEYRPLLSNKNLHRFLNRNEKVLVGFGYDEAKGLVAEVKTLWPEIPLTPDAVLQLKQGLEESLMAVEYRHLRGFLFHAAKKLARRPDLDITRVGALKHLVEDARDEVRDIIGSAPPSSLSIERDACRAFLSAMIQKLKQISLVGQQYSEKIRAVNGDQISQATLPEIWETFKEAMDVDTAKLLLGQALRYLATEMINKNDDTADMVDELTEELERSKI
jgi:hypothetical protein